MTKLMISPLISTILTVYCSPLQAAEKKDIVVGESAQLPIHALTLELKPKWTKGALVNFEKNDTASPVLHWVDASHQESTLVFTLDGAASIHIGDAAFGSATLAFTGFAADPDQRGAAFIAFVSTVSKEVTTVRLSNFRPELITVAQDGTVWIKGWQPGANGKGLDLTAMVLRQYDRTGKMLNGFVSQKDALALMERYQLTGVAGHLTSSLTRIGWHEFRNGPYFEISLDTLKLSQYPAVPVSAKGEFISGLAITENGTVVANTSVWCCSDLPKGAYLYVLDRSNGVWERIDLYKGKFSPQLLGRLLGAEGDKLVMANRAGNANFVSLK